MCLSAALLLAACGDEPTTPRRVTGSVAGTVTNAVDGNPVAGASVRAGNVVDTTGADGHFMLAGVPAGPANLQCTAPGFTDFEVRVTVTSDRVTQDITLNRRFAFDIGRFALYVPANVDTIRGLIVVLGGDDTRWIATLTSTESVAPSLWHLGQSLRNLPASHGLAILGTSHVAMPNDSDSDQMLLTAVSLAASMSRHPELETAPLLLYGMSTGGPEASGFAARNPERVAGLFLKTPLGVSAVRSGNGLGVPTFVALAALDARVDNVALTRVFEGNRAAGARWALAVEAAVPHDELSVAQHQLTIDWISTIVQLRLPANRSDQLREVAETSGWVGNPATGQAAPWASYAGDRAIASWLPSQRMAERWEGLMARRRIETFEIGDFAMYVPASVPLVRGVILALGGPDTRGFATGKRMGAPIADVEASLQILGQRFRTLASTHGLAIVGTSRVRMPNEPASDSLLFGAVERLAAKSGRPEISVPYFLMYGMAAGAPEASGFTARNPMSVAGLFLKVPLGASSVSGRALEVPTYMVLAELDAPVNNAASTAAFESNRGAGALWGLAMERGVPHHSLSPLQRQVTVNWISTILERRLPYEPGWDPLYGISEASGWLGNRITGEALPWANYAGDRTLASWLPSEAIATEWETLVAPAAVTSSQRVPIR
jgi:dienelactone hydrolase